MATQQELMRLLERSARRSEVTADAYDEVLTSEGEIDVKLSDGTVTPNLNKRIKAYGSQVTSVVGKKGDVTITDISEGLELGSASKYNVADLPVTQKQRDEFIGTVESIADLIAIKNPKDGQVIRAKGYHRATNFALAKPYKGGGDFEYKGDATDEVNEGTIFKPNSGNGRWFRILSGEFNASWFGAKGLGQTGDQQCISKAYEYLNSIGGGTLNLDDGVYLIDTVNYVKEAETGPSLNEQYAFPIYSNITVQGESRENTIFKMADGIIYKDLQQANIGCALFADAHKRIDIENFTIRNFKVDMNGINNILVDLPTEGGLAGTQQAIFPVLYFFDYYTSKNITVDNIWVHQNSGMNSIYIGHKSINPTVQNCLFTDHADYIVGNEHIKDHSTIYMCGLDGKIHNNRFIMSRDAISTNARSRVSYISTAIEAHGVNTLVTSNIVDGYGAPFLAASTETYNGDNIQFIGNRAYEAQIGFAFNSMSGQLNAKFIGNTVVLRKEKSKTDENFLRYSHAAVESMGALNSIVQVDRAYSEIYVLNNTFEQQEPADWNDADMSINVCHNIKEAKLYVAKGNTFKNFKGAAYNCLIHRDFLLARHELDENTYIDCGQDTGYNKYRAAYNLSDIPFIEENGFYYGLLDRLSVSNEKLIDCKYGVLVAKSNDLTARQVSFNNIETVGATFIPPVILAKPIDIVSGHTFHIDYESNGRVQAGQSLDIAVGVSGEVRLRNWSSNVDNNLLTTLKYVKTAYYPWNMRAVSANIPTSAQFGAFANRDGDKIEAISAHPNNYSSFTLSNGKWYGLGLLSSAIT